MAGSSWARRVAESAEERPYLPEVPFRSICSIQYGAYRAKGLSKKRSSSWACIRLGLVFGRGKSAPTLLEYPISFPRVVPSVLESSKVERLVVRGSFRQAMERPIYQHRDGDRDKTTRRCGHWLVQVVDSPVLGTASNSFRLTNSASCFKL
jgi:hypothetical protein